MQIVVFGAPMGKERPRASMIGGHARIYTPKKTQSYESRFAYAWSEKYSNEALTRAPIKVTVRAVFPLSKGDYKKDGTPTKSGFRKLSGDEKPSKRPDIDNICKAVLDGLNGVAFADDSQITLLIATKEYGESPRVEVEIEEE